MFAIFRVEPDVDQFQSLYEDNAQAVYNRDFDGAPLAAKWTPLGVHKSAEPDLEEPDVWSCFARTLAIRPEMANPLKTFLSSTCELLPLTSDIGSLLLVNVICVIDCLDANKSEFKGGLTFWITRYIFQKDKLSPSGGLFKIPQTAPAEILCLSRSDDPCEDFRSFVKSKGIRGLQFHELWSSAE